MLTNRFNDALVFAASAHKDHVRKGSGIPYIAHLMSVSALTLEYGGDETCAIAALLHDAVENQGGMAMADQIGTQFGDEVRAIVLECSDLEDATDMPWRTRKQAYLSAIPHKSDSAILVTTCDKLHNATSILHDLREDGVSVFSRFSGGRDGTMWYYRQLADTLAMRAPYPLAFRLNVIVAQLEAEVSLKLSSDG